MNSLPPLLLAIPFGAAVIAAVLGPRRGPIIRWLSLLATVVTLILALNTALEFALEQGQEPPGPAPTFRPKMVTQVDLLHLQTASTRPAVVQFYVGVDGLNVWLVVLTALLMVPAVLVSWTAVEERVNEYYAWLLALESAMLGVFLSFDVILFYVFFELTLVPLFFLIGIWGGPQRQYAARKFFIYTLAGSVITLLGVLGVAIVHYVATPNGELTFSIPRLVDLTQQVLHQPPSETGPDWQRVQLFVFLALMAGFAIKVPLVPVHTWLPLAHTEAPTAGSVILAGVLLKIGVYGFLRLCVPLAPDASLTFGTPLIGTLAVIGIIYGAFCAVAQDDIKKLVAYSSVSHLGFCMLGLFALNEVGLAGSMIQMINHGLSTGALFLLVGMLYERYHTRRIADYGGMAARLHLLGAAFVFICLTSVGLPGLNGFVGELLTMMGMWDHQGGVVHGRVLTALASTGVVLGAWYLFTLLRRVFFGEIKEPHHAGQGPIRDLNGREIAALAPIVVVCVLLGVYPKPFLDVAAPDLQKVARIAKDAMNRGQGSGVRSQESGVRNQESRDRNPESGIAARNP